MGFGKRVITTGGVDAFNKGKVRSQLQKELRGQVEESSARLLGDVPSVGDLATQVDAETGVERRITNPDVERENVIKKAEVEKELDFLRSRERQIRGLTARPGRRASILTRR